MLRRCLATPYPCFGAVPPPRTGPQATAADQGLPEFGTMLEIRNVQMLPNGQCRVETWGTWRFRILERGNLDGYDVARIERVDDVLEDDNEAAASSSQSEGASHIGSSEDGTSRGDSQSNGTRSSNQSPKPRMRSYRSNQDLMDVCHAFLDQLRQGTPWVGQQLDNSYVPMPEDPALFSFWMGLVR